MLYKIFNLKSQIFEFPSFENLIVESSKLKYLDNLLKKLKK